MVTLYNIGEMHFRSLGTNGYHVKAKNERFNAASSRCRQSLKHENLALSFGRLRQEIALTGVPHVRHDYFSSFNQSNHWFVTLKLPVPLPSSFHKLPNKQRQRRRQRERHLSIELRTSVIIPRFGLQNVR